ncbi:MAG: hypothetical protein AAFW97_07255 [Pseudomonadota bacterium]
MKTDFFATLRELRTARHRRSIMRAPQIIERDAERRQARHARSIDRRLDDALADTFPASDPIALSPRPIQQ